MKKIFFYVTFLFSLLITLYFAVTWIQRVILPYNSEGKYFDEVNVVTYNESGVTAYGILTLLGAIISTLIYMIVNRKRINK